MAAIQVGDRAPEFSAEAHSGGQIALSQFLGQQVVVLFFYPKDHTSICTAQVCSFRDSYEDFTKAGAVVLGASSDTITSHRDFASKRRLPFLLLSDADGQLRKAFGVPRTLGILPGRVTYVIDRQGIVRLVFNSQFNASKHVTKALQVVQQYS